MKKMIVAAFFAVLIVLSSCKNEKTVNETKPENNFKVTFDLTITQADSLQLFYSDKDIADFKENMSLWVPVQGDSVSQVVDFNLPEGIVPTALRLDFKKNSGEISFNNFKMTYKDKVYSANDSIIGYLFSTNSYMTATDTTKTTVKFVESDSNFDPFIYSGNDLKNIISTFVK